MAKPTIFPFQDGRDSGEYNRAYQMRRDNDTVKVPQIGLYDIDYSILYGLSEQVKPVVEQNGSAIKVPVIYVDGEKFSQIRQHGYLRDVHKKIVSPVIGIRRTSVAEDERFPMLDLNKFAPSRKIYPYRTFNMVYDRLAGQVRRENSVEYYLLDVPTFVRVSYDVTIWCDFIEHSNKIVQSIMVVNDHIWGDYYKFRVNVSNASNDVVSTPGESRIVKTTLNMVVDGYLMEAYEYQESTLQKQFSLKTIKLFTESEGEDIYINSTSMQPSRHHMTQEPISDMDKTKKRNIRY